MTTRDTAACRCGEWFEDHAHCNHTREKCCHCPCPDPIFAVVPKRRRILRGKVIRRG